MASDRGSEPGPGPGAGAEPPNKHTQAALAQSWSFLTYTATSPSPATPAGGLGESTASQASASTEPRATAKAYHLQSPPTTVNGDSDNNDIEAAIRRAIKHRPRDIDPPKQPVASQPPTGLALLAQSNQPNNCTFDAATCEFRSGPLTFKNFLANPKQNKKPEVTALERDTAKDEARIKDIVLKPKAAEPPQSSTRKRSLKRSLLSVDDLESAIQKSSHKKSFLSIDDLESVTQKPSYTRSFLSVDDLEAPIQPPQLATQKPSLKRSFLSVEDLEEAPIIPTTTSDASRHGRIKRHKRDDKHRRHLSSHAAIPDRGKDLSFDSLAAPKRHTGREKAGRDNGNHHHHRTGTTAASARIGNPSLDRDISRAFSESQVVRENFKAIRHAPITAGAKAQTRLDELRKAGTDGGAGAAAGRPAANPTTPQSAEDLFRDIIANHDRQQPKTRIVNNLPSGDRQKEAINRRPQGPRPDVGFTPLRRPGKNNAVNPTARAGVPRSQQAFNAAPTLSSGNKNGKAPAVVRTNIFQQQQRHRPVVPPPVLAPHRPGSGLKAPYHRPHQVRGDDEEEEEEYAQSPPASAVIPPPRNVAQAEELLGGDRIVRNWVVYRTAKSMPETTAVAASATGGGGKAIWCSDFLSKAAANTQAQILHDRAKKGVVDKTWSRAGPEGLFRGTLQFEAGETQRFWVEEVVRDLSAVVATRRMASDSSSGSSALFVDSDRARVYERKRYDVVSVRYFGVPGGAFGYTAAAGKQQQQRGGTKKGSRSNRPIVIDCSDESDEADEIIEIDSGSDMEPAAAAVSTPREMTADSHRVATDSEDQEMTDAAQDGKEDGGDNATAATAAAREASISSGDTSSSQQQHDNHHRNVRESTAATSRTMAGAELANVLDAVDPRVELHSTFTTAKLANAEAMRTFLELARPDNSRIEDNHLYKTHIRPSYEAQFDAHTAAVVDGGVPETLLQVEWDPPAGPRYRWPFFRLGVEVMESLLRGPLDIGDMVVDGGAEEGTGAGAGAGVRAADDEEMSEEE